MSVWDDITDAAEDVFGGTGVSTALGQLTGADAREAEDAAAEAADIQAKASKTNIAESARQFDVTQANLLPFQEAGVGALSQQQALLGLSGEDEQQQAFAAFEDTPGQRFLRERC